MISIRAHRIATPAGEVHDQWVNIENTFIGSVTPDPLRGAERIDLGSADLLPGLVDLHSDCLGRHRHPRVGAEVGLGTALLAMDAEAAAHGVTTNFVCVNFETDPAKHHTSHAALDIIEALADWQPLMRVDHYIHARVELWQADLTLAAQGLAHPRTLLTSYKENNDDLNRPTDVDAVRQRIWRETHPTEPTSITPGDVLDDVRRHVCHLALRDGLVLASHDDTTPAAVATAVRHGVHIAEFPLTADAAAAAADAGLGIVMGAPNAVRGRSHLGHLSARAVAASRTLGALVSDYHAPSLLASVYALSAAGICTWNDAVALATTGPARMVRLDDRGAIAPGQRADLIAVHHHLDQPVVRGVWRNGKLITPLLQPSDQPVRSTGFQKSYS